ncbi:hypothetical protein [Pseudomonas phage Astolliot]|nr:hypothetical protein [Pseudomonas phage Astolliot]
MIKIVKFAGTNLYNGDARKGYQAKVLLEQDGVERLIHLPVRGYSTADVISKARMWRKIPGNIERLQEAFDNGDTSIKAIQVKK